MIIYIYTLYIYIHVIYISLRDIYIYIIYVISIYVYIVSIYTHIYIYIIYTHITYIEKKVLWPTILPCCGPMLRVAAPPLRSCISTTTRILVTSAPRLCWSPRGQLVKPLIGDTRCFVCWKITQVCTIHSVPSEHGDSLNVKFMSISSKGKVGLVYMYTWCMHHPYHITRYNT